MKKTFRHSLFPWAYAGERPGEERLTDSAASYPAPVSLSTWVVERRSAVAIFPCAVGAHRYPQPQQTAYIVLAGGMSVSTSKARFCPAHFRAFVERAAEKLLHVESDSRMSTLCQSCEAPGAQPVFVRAFPRDGEEEVFYRDVCAACRLALVEQLQEGAYWAPMAIREG